MQFHFPIGPKCHIQYRRRTFLREIRRDDACAKCLLRTHRIAYLGQQYFFRVCTFPAA